MKGESMEILGLHGNTKRTVVVLGAFDGIHKGHVSLMKTGKALAEKKHAHLAVMTFDEHPDKVLKDSPIKLLTTQEEQLAILKEYGVEIVFRPCFREIASLNAETFFSKVLLEDFNAQGLVVGSNFRFGKKARGNSQLLYSLGKKENIPVIICQAVKNNNQIISSTLIRRLLNSGKVSLSNALLGRRFSLTGVVIQGEGRGRRLNTPTANLLVAQEKLIPACGVYLVEGFWEGRSAFGLLSISKKPTFLETGEIAVEVYFLDIDEDLYGKTIKLEFIEYFRGIEKYNTAEELMFQLEEDKKRARHGIKYYIDRK
jgi:riboflavin kinase/FMN adenylyltransferase